VGNLPERITYELKGDGREEELDSAENLTREASGGKVFNASTSHGDSVFRPVAKNLLAIGGGKV